MGLETFCKRLLPCLFFLIVSPCHAETALTGAQELDTEHQRGVKLAREGRYDDGLAVLAALQKKYPDSYPLERDIIVITAWKGDCRSVVRRYERLRNHPDPEPYFILPVSECLGKIGRIDEAISLLNEGQKRWPDDSSLVSAYTVMQTKRAALFKNELRLEVISDTSDQGKREWFYGSLLARRVADRARVYARTANTRSRYDQYQSGKLDRVGVGIDYELRNNVLLTQEFSYDIRRHGQNGSLTSVVYLPTDLWRFGASYTTFAEDLPLRAKAELIDAKRSIIFTDYHTPDYRWSWAASGSRYDFSDTNRRSTLFTSLGYAYEMKPKREQRVFLEYYESDNTLANTAYYNPSHDKSVSLVHKTDFVFDSRFRRHVDHLYLSLGQYDEKGFPAHGIWTVRYEQSYDFTDRTALLFGVDYGRRVYDGASEYVSNMNAVFRWFF